MMPLALAFPCVASVALRDLGYLCRLAVAAISRQLLLVWIVDGQARAFFAGHFW